MAFSPDGRTLASGAATGRCGLRNVTDPAHPTLLGQSLTGTPQFVWPVFSPGGHSPVSGYPADNNTSPQVSPPQPAAHTRLCLAGSTVVTARCSLSDVSCLVWTIGPSVALKGAGGLFLCVHDG